MLERRRHQPVLPQAPYKLTMTLQLHRTTVHLCLTLQRSLRLPGTLKGDTEAYYNAHGCYRALKGGPRFGQSICGSASWGIADSHSSWLGLRSPRCQIRR